MNISDLDYQQIPSNEWIILGGSSTFDSFDFTSILRDPGTNEIVATGTTFSFAQATGIKSRAMVTGFSATGFGNGILSSQSSSTASSSSGEPQG